jgi:ABC-type lipoprotein release transport system permease subunit
LGNILNALGHDRDTQILLMSWAEKHPYLFTLIEVTTPSLYVIIIVAGFNVINGMLRVKRR